MPGKVQQDHTPVEAKVCTAYLRQSFGGLSESLPNPFSSWQIRLLTGPYAIEAWNVVRIQASPVPQRLPRGATASNWSGRLGHAGFAVCL